MINQQQATASVATIGLVLAYVLWSIIGTDAFLPYVSIGTPHVGNILLFLTLFSLILSAAITVVVSLLVTVISWLRKREHSVVGTTIWTIFITIFMAIFPALLLHVFSLVPIQVTLLSYVVVYGIVGYGKFKARHKYKKYLTASSGAGTSKSSNEVRVQ